MLLTALILIKLKDMGCKKLCNLNDDVYQLIQTFSIQEYINGYRRVNVRGMQLYEGKPIKRKVQISLEAEDFAARVLKERGAGYIDFQMPDKSWRDSNFGFTSFPSHVKCQPILNNTSIYLSSMLAVNGFRPKLIEYFIKHYSNIGILKRNMLFTVQLGEEVDIKILRDLINILKSHGVYFDVVIGEWSSEVLMYHQAHKLLHCTHKNDWIIVADSDEFHEYPDNNVTKFLADLDSKSYNVVNGFFMDRLTQDGRLQDIFAEENLFQKFPLGCRLHNLFNLGTPKKVMAFKGYLRINRGHHRIALCWFWNRRNYLYLTPWSECPPKSHFEPNPWEKRLNVHHFKWMKGQYEATLHKANVWKGTAVEKSYLFVLDHLNQCNGVCVSNPKNKCTKKLSQYMKVL